MSHADIEAELDDIADEIDARVVEEEALSQVCFPPILLETLSCEIFFSFSGH
jgi:hypothetical protein